MRIASIIGAAPTVALLAIAVSSFPGCSPAGDAPPPSGQETAETAAERVISTKAERSFRFEYAAALPELDATGAAELWIPLPLENLHQEISGLEIDAPG